MTCLSALKRDIPDKGNIKILCDPLFAHLDLPPEIQCDLLLTPPPLPPKRLHNFWTTFDTNLSIYSWYPLLSSVSRVSNHLPKYIPLCKSLSWLSQYLSMKITPLKPPFDNWSCEKLFPFWAPSVWLIFFTLPPPSLWLWSYVIFWWAPFPRMWYFVIFLVTTSPRKRIA